jgi:hypothetical protein
MKRIFLAFLVLALGVLACGQYVTPTSIPNALGTPDATHRPLPTPTPTVTQAQPTATEEAQTAIVRAALVNVRSSPGGEVVRQIEAGTEVVILQIVKDDQGDEWAMIAQDEYVFKGCLSIADGQGCEAK